MSNTNKTATSHHREAPQDPAVDRSPPVEDDPGVEIATGNSHDGTAGTVLLPHPNQPTWRQDYPYDTKMTEREYQGRETLAPDRAAQDARVGEGLPTPRSR